MASHPDILKIQIIGLFFKIGYTASLNWKKIFELVVLDYIFIILTYLIASGLLSGGSGYYACT
jgi:hypothetical protein